MLFFSSEKASIKLSFVTVFIFKLIWHTGAVYYATCGVNNRTVLNNLIRTSDLCSIFISPGVSQFNDFDFEFDISTVHGESPSLFKRARTCTLQVLKTRCALSAFECAFECAPTTMPLHPCLHTLVSRPPWLSFAGKKNSLQMKFPLKLLYSLSLELFCWYLSNSQSLLKTLRSTPKNWMSVLEFVALQIKPIFTVKWVGGRFKKWIKSKFNGLSH